MYLGQVLRYPKSATLLLYPRRLLVRQSLTTPLLRYTHYQLIKHSIRNHGTLLQAPSMAKRLCICQKTSRTLPYRCLCWPLHWQGFLLCTSHHPDSPSHNPHLLSVLRLFEYGRLQSLQNSIPDPCRLDCMLFLFLWF